ncbi:MAG: hypothetical protein ACTH6S_12345 [Mesonia sp.]|uniref:hypothetical protein n=1 Tax=Mesonia sp. TaxID=1960830 RepID=UPI003F9A25C8
MENNFDKVLILYNSVPYFESCFQARNIPVARTFRKISIPLKLIRKINALLKLPRDYWFGEWKKKLLSIDTIIVFSPIERDILQYIKKENEKIRIIYWYWNPILRSGKPSKEIYNLSEIWSFDPNDCKKYDLKYNTTFYFKNIKLPKNKIEFDVSFLGINKGRRKELENIEGVLNKNGLKTYFHIVPDKHESDESGPQPISYPKYLELLSKSKAILDINPIGQSGQTLRPMESIFLTKKLITNDGTITSCDFYKPENIFVLGQDDEKDLNQFINSPYEEVDEAIVARYDVKNWLRRFNL